MGLLGSQDDKKQEILYRKWVRANKEKAKIPQFVTSISLSSTEEWIMIKTSEAVAFINAESAIGIQLWESLKEFNGEGLALTIYPVPGKIGFDLDFHESAKMFYTWEDDLLTIGKKSQKKKQTIGSKITWKQATSYQSSIANSHDVKSSLATEDVEQDTSQIATTKPANDKNGKKTNISNSSTKRTLQEPTSKTTSTTPISVSEFPLKNDDQIGQAQSELPFEEE
jgi:hypothetical protein